MPKSLFNSTVFHVEPMPGQPGRHVVRHPGAVAILPVHGDAFLLIQNHRRSIGTTLLEVPAGTLEKGEDPQQAAIRELAEETGATAQSWKPFGHFWSAPGFCDERLHLFVADELTLGAPILEAHEEIECLLVPQSEAIAAAASGVYEDAKTAAIILRFAMLRDG
ncbi:MAG: hypothetical protein CMJ28_03040 [Phycisphaerae bacterium]|nr:hypothetical protein [Phycisphaerae bacterium]